MTEKQWPREARRIVYENMRGRLRHDFSDAVDDYIYNDHDDVESFPWNAERNESELAAEKAQLANALFFLVKKDIDNIATTPHTGRGGKLTCEQQAQIVAKHGQGATGKELAAEYDVSERTIYRTVSTANTDTDSTDNCQNGPFCQTDNCQNEVKRSEGKITLREEKENLKSGGRAENSGEEAPCNKPEVRPHLTSEPPLADAAADGGKHEAARIDGGKPASMTAAPADVPPYGNSGSGVGSNTAEIGRRLMAEYFPQFQAESRIGGEHNDYPIF